MKNTWKGINRLIGNESEFNKITQLDTGYSVSTDPIEISNILNTHFSKIGPSLASEIQNTSNNFTDYITPTEQFFQLAEVSCQEVFNLIQKIPSNKTLCERIFGRGHTVIISYQRRQILYSTCLLNHTAYTVCPNPQQK